MRVSICMATHNREAGMLARVLDSIFRQKPPFEFEVVVCDDGPEDDSAEEACGRYPVNYHRIDRPPGPRNPCVARNVAYKAARGDIIIAQSDDVAHVSPNAISTLVMELETRPGAFVIASVLACGPDGEPWSVYTGRWCLPKEQASGHVCSHQERNLPYFFLGALWRKDLYAIGGNDEDFVGLAGYEDEWFSDCLVQGLGLRPVYVSSVVGHHLYHPRSDTDEGAQVAKEFHAKKVKQAEATGAWMASGGPWPCDSTKLTSVMEETFVPAYGKDGEWAGYDSGSGQGSSLEATHSLRKALPDLLGHYHIKTLLDIPCGDFFWMSKVGLEGVEYIGADVLSSLVVHNGRAFPGRDFRRMDVTVSQLPTVDLVLCRDCLGHLSFADCHRALGNIKASGSKWLLTTTFWNHPNVDIATGPDWRPRSLTLPPFSLPPPLLVIDELCKEAYPEFADKSMALWELSAI